MGRKILRVILWFIILASISSTVLFLISRAWEESGIFVALLLIIPAIIAGIFLGWVRNRDKLGKLAELREPYEVRLKQWEAEGYDVSEFRDKWLPTMETRVRSGKYWLAIVLTIIILPAASFAWWAMQVEAPIPVAPEIPEQAVTPVSPATTEKAVTPVTTETPTISEASVAPAPLPQPATDDVYRLKAYTYTPEGVRVTEAMRKTIELVTEKTGGRVTFDFQEAGELFDRSKTDEAVCRRDVDIAFLPLYYNYSRPLSSLLFKIPGLIPDAQIMQRGLDEGVADMIRPEWDAGEGTAISFFPLSCYDMSTASHSHMVKIPDDLKGLKVRPSSEVALQVLELCGATPVVIATTEVYTALERGVIDGLLANPEAFKIYQWSEVTKYYTWIHLTYDLGAIFMNKEALNSLPPDLRETFLDAWQNAYPDYNLQLMEKSYAALRSTLQSGTEDGSIIFHETTPAERKVWFEKLADPTAAWLITEKNADKDTILKAIDMYKKFW